MNGKVYLVGSAEPRALREALHRALADVGKPSGSRRPRIALSSASILGGRAVSRISSFLGGVVLHADVTPFTVAGEPGAMPPSEAKGIVDQADIIFLGGGDPILGARRLNQAGADAWVRDARARGAVCVGISAGSIALCAAWGSWEDDEEGEPAIVPGLRVVPNLVVDCHAEEDDWGELRAVKKAMGKSGATLTFAGIRSGAALVVGPNGEFEWMGRSMVLG